MKIAALLTVASLTCGAAFAQTNTPAGQDPMAPRTAERTSVPQVPHGKPGGVVDKTKNAMHRMGDKMRHAGKRVDNAVPRYGDARDARDTDTRDHAMTKHGRRDHAMKDYDSRNHAMDRDTRSMGAAGSDSSRQARMDDAYANWKSRQR